MSRVNIIIAAPKYVINHKCRDLRHLIMTAGDSIHSLKLIRSII